MSVGVGATSSTDETLWAARPKSRTVIVRHCNTQEKATSAVVFILLGGGAATYDSQSSSLGNALNFGPLIPPSPGK